MQQDTKPTNGRSKSRLIIAATAAVFILLLIVVAVLGHKKKDDHSLNGVSLKEGAALQQDVESYHKTVTSPTKVFDLKLDGTKVVQGPTAIKVQKGDVVQVNIRPTAGEVRVELQGYDIITESDATSKLPGGFQFIADKTGTFSINVLATESESDGGQEHDFDTPASVATLEVTK